MLTNNIWDRNLWTRALFENIFEYISNVLYLRIRNLLTEIYEAIEVLKRNIYEWEQRKKVEENGKLSCGIYSSPAAALHLLQRLGRQSHDS